MALMALPWALDGGIFDVRLLKDPADVIVSEANLPAKTELPVPNRKVTVLSPKAIQERADKQGDFLYFKFGPFRPTRKGIRVAISLVWAIATTSEATYLSGGGATLDFEKREGKWQLLPVTNRWIS
jgi:hypothetical protein